MVLSVDDTLYNSNFISTELYRVSKLISTIAYFFII